VADFLASEKQWDKLVAICRKAGVIGLDTEFYGLNVSKESCVGRARVHVWSVAVRTSRMGPRGHTLCRGWCLPAAALAHPPVRELLEDKSVRKMVHNQPVDHHSLRNHGIRLRGAVNTLGLVKWARPDLINTPGRFRLKTLMTTLLGREPVCSFDDVVSDTRTITVTKTKRVRTKGCECGAVKCRKRQGEHRKWSREEDIEVSREKQEAFKWPLEDIVPGHPRWDLLVRYAIEDSVAALQIAELAYATPNPAPWPYGFRGEDTIRPGFSQPVEEAIIQMERTGFRADKEFCATQLATAAIDEERTLNWLHKWAVLNSGRYGPHKRRAVVAVRKDGKEVVKSGSDSLWSSPTKRLELFDELGFPRSPVWGKGRVKDGHPKLDGAAMKWIMSNHLPAKAVGEKLRLLGYIRSGKKYLTKLLNSGELIHPICGPAGDEDERSGAVTGRLGVKGELESQQLPKAGDKDLYSVRRAITA
jgi:hypothetical protein